MRCGARAKPGSACTTSPSSRPPARASQGWVGTRPRRPPLLRSSSPHSAGDSEVIEVRQELRRQIARLEAELTSYVRDLPSDMPTAHPAIAAHLLSVEELEETRDTLIAKLSEAQKAAELRAREEGRVRAQREEALRERGSQSSAADLSPLGKAMSWWQSKS